jgi:competence protein ComEC
MFFWSRYPFLRLVLFFILGILLGIYYPGIARLSQIGLVVSILCLTYLVVKRKSLLIKFNYLFGITLSAVFLFLGYLSLIQSGESNQPDHLVNISDGRYYSAKVVSGTQLKGDFLRLKIETMGVKDSIWRKASGRVLVYLKRPVTYMPQYGDMLLITGFPHRVSAPLNPDEFDYKQYLAYNNIHHQHFVNSDKWRLLKPSSGISAHGLSIKARNYLEKKLASFITEPQALAVAKALILGKKEDLDGNTKEIYATAGAMHILAVSGLHVGIIYLVLLGLLRQKQGRITKPILVAAIIIPALWAYAFITGLSPSVLRAVTMFSFLALSQVINRRAASLNTLAISAFILLLVNPNMIMAVGFQLSYVAVAGIIFLYPAFEKWLNPENSILRFAWQITALSLAAQLVTAPLSAFYFHRFPTYFIFSNLLVIPAATIIVWGGLILLTIGSISSTLGILLGNILSMIIWLVNNSLKWITSLPFADINSLSSTIFDTWIFYAIIILAFLFFHKRNWSFYWISAALVIIFSFSAIYSNISQNKLKQLTFYSVNNSWAVDFIAEKRYHFIADSVLLADSNKINYHITPYRRQNGFLPANNNLLQPLVTDIGEVIVWHDKRILLANACLAENEIPQVFDFVLFKAGRTPGNCYQEQILLRKFVSDQERSYARYNLHTQGALIVDI